MVASPKFQFQPFNAPALGTDRSVNVSTLPSQPDGKQKLAVGNGFTITVAEPVCAWLHNVADASAILIKL